MGLYYYRGKRLDGKKKSGLVVGEKTKDALRNLELQGFKNPTIRYLSSFGGLEYYIFADISPKSINKQNMAYLFEQLAFLLTSGISLTKAIEVICASPNLKVARVAITMSPMLFAGASLDTAMTRTKMFPYEIIAQIKAGTDSGTLLQSLNNIAKKLRDSIELKKKVTSSLVYPCFMLLMLIVVTVAMLAFIVPSISTAIKEMGGELPSLTQYVIGASDAFIEYWYYGAGIIVIIGVSHFVLTNNVKVYKYNFDKIKYKIPIVGELLMKADTIKICNLMTQMLNSGLNLATALNILNTTLKNTFLRHKMNLVSQDVEREGVDLYDALEKQCIFQLEFLQLVKIGTEAGNLPDVLENVYLQYSRDLENSIKSVTSMIEPISILVTAVVGGVVVISMYLPIFSVVDTFK